ncbi:MAG TPA: hypothetical protein PK264_24030, partial [Hyphomicrobiaceae bacterium]|nr:hypothetical protein [Hyphomicrobiaceae bacterium]
MTVHVLQQAAAPRLRPRLQWTAGHDRHPPRRHAGRPVGGPARRAAQIRGDLMPKFAANLSFLFTELPFLDRFEAAAKAG